MLSDMGDLKPKQQADIENAMHQWLASRGESASTSATRPRARMLWQAIKSEAEN
ncbi:hypothetical protein SAMN05444161_8288 [Rhizobiales bacterium GAS191]|nr:hypothetical protein SAMN05444161_8288 [Rhizobiales bacterium GAS191]